MTDQNTTTIEGLEKITGLSAEKLTSLGVMAILPIITGQTYLVGGANLSAVSDRDFDTLMTALYESNNAKHLEIGNPIDYFDLDTRNIILDLVSPRSFVTLLGQVSELCIQTHEHRQDFLSRALKEYSLCLLFIVSSLSEEDNTSNSEIVEAFEMRILNGILSPTERHFINEDSLSTLQSIICLYREKE